MTQQSTQKKGCCQLWLIVPTMESCFVVPLKQEPLICRVRIDYTDMSSLENSPF